MRSLYNTGHGVRDLLTQARETAYKEPAPRAKPNQPEKPPEAIGAAVDSVLGKILERARPK